MTAKEIFRAAYEAQKDIKALQRRREHYLEMALSGSGMSETHIRSTEVKSRTEAAAIGLAAVALELEKPMERYLAAVKRAELIMQRIDKPRYREVLQLHYLEGKPWQQVSAEMGYQDPKSVFRVHGWALQAADKIMSCR